MIQAGHTPLSIAQRLGYVSVVELLKNVTDQSVAPTVQPVAGDTEKYKVTAPETMQEAPMSESDDEGGKNCSHCVMSLVVIGVSDTYYRNYYRCICICWLTFAKLP